VQFLALLQPSRQDVPEYAAYLAEIGAAAASVNARFGTGDWQPVDLRLASDMALATRRTAAATCSSSTPWPTG
jgi:trehalose 6-phosphate synthase